MLVKPMSIIPPDVLAEIFRLSIGNPVAEEKNRKAIGRVCRSWRRILLCTKSLWSTIVIQPIPLPGRHPIQQQANTTNAPDVSCLVDCLTLSYPHPLDIYISLPVSTTDQRPLLSAARLLATHSIRWRNFSCVAPEWFFSFLDHIETFPILETITLNGNTPYFTDSGKSPISFSSTLRSINVNFNLPRLQPQWASITSFTGGFDSQTNCHATLSQLKNLTTLHINHLVYVERNDRPRCTYFNHVHHLTLSQCAVVATLREFRFPKLLQLSITQPGHHVEAKDRSMGCPNEIVAAADIINHLIHLVNPPRPPGMSYLGNQKADEPTLHTLDVSWSLDPCLLEPLLRTYQENIKHLKITFVSGNMDKATAFFGSLINPNGNIHILPNLRTLDIVAPPTPGNNFFRGSSLETLIVALAKAPSKLQRLRLYGAVSVSYIYEDLDNTEKLFVVSSLSFKLLELTQHHNDKRLEVEWRMGRVDILEKARRHQRAVLFKSM